ncbi:hypothetical protein FNV43_RR24756 [Rhamnella rubrinervis]|uniref:Uncharacterized protein n=1 Tax=Rhamnella rubrinervis TaxID=2594499 RepID=A0A8K0DT09_9ROSA|nr:hypothetical protein FNV43_RR24756 [Rhamnella rubrinervis]
MSPLKRLRKASEESTFTSTKATTFNAPIKKRSRMVEKSSNTLKDLGRLIKGALLCTKGSMLNRLVKGLDRIGQGYHFEYREDAFGQPADGEFPLCKHMPLSQPTEALGRLAEGPFSMYKNSTLSHPVETFRRLAEGVFCYTEGRHPRPT